MEPVFASEMEPIESVPESESKKIELEFKTEQYNDIVYKTTMIDKDYIGWRYQFPTEGIVVVINSFDDIINHIINWKMYQLLEHIDDEFSLNLFVRDPAVQILTWNDLTERDERINGGYVVEALVFDEKINFHDMLNCIKYHLSLQKIDLSETKIYKELNTNLFSMEYEIIQGLENLIFG